MYRLRLIMSILLWCDFDSNGYVCAQKISANNIIHFFGCQGMPICIKGNALGISIGMYSALSECHQE